jgi:hypothetical protein
MASDPCSDMCLGGYGQADIAVIQHLAHAQILRPFLRWYFDLHIDDVLS